MKSIVYMDACAEHVYDMFDINIEIWGDTYINQEYNITEQDASFGPEDRVNQKKIDSRISEIRINPGAFHIAMYDGKIIGFAGGRKYDQYNELFSVHVRKKFQGNGIGTQLVKRVFDYLGTDKDIIVQVVAYNKNAIRFYENIGFKFDKQLQDLEILKGKFVPEIQMIYKFY